MATEIYSARGGDAAAGRRCRSLGIDFRGSYDAPDEPDTG